MKIFASVLKKWTFLIFILMLKTTDLMISLMLMRRSIFVIFIYSLIFWRMSFTSRLMKLFIIISTNVFVILHKINILISYQSLNINIYEKITELNNKKNCFNDSNRLSLMWWRHLKWNTIQFRMFRIIISLLNLCLMLYDMLRMLK